ncbi:GNAT family N-acetyltransferase [Salinicoccus albus]|uniref:GNAT family N-acetyltransferase n=1 Tax=Salinicoccus albus TaxID=418756 RepID=UPI0003707A76|nr:GNAT family N-acetyltransferase [Salinicoccus albus]
MIDIRKLKTMDELAEIGKMERKIWGMDPIPTHQTLTAVKNGGIMLGAFDEGQLIGFSYGFAGFRDGNSYLCSHMLGIDPRYRSRKIGEKLKQTQRQTAIDKGYDEMHWTFDPLETRNAYLNLTKLNGICNTYVENTYGEMKDSLNKDMPSDRFEIHWFLRSPHVVEKQLPGTEHAARLNGIQWNGSSQPEFTDKEVSISGNDVYALLVPKDFQGLKQQNHAIALDWRLKTRKVCQELFNAGYAAVRLNVLEHCGEYIFVRTDTLELGGKQ